MKTLRYVVLLSLTVVLLASCGGLPVIFPATAPAAVAPAEEAAPSAPAEQPAVAPAEGTTAAPAPGDATAAPAAPAAPTTETPAAPAEPVMGADPLVGVVWEWAALLKTKPATQSVVPDPASYTAIFDGEGNLLIQADCNNARATYILDNEVLSIQLGPVTRAACMPGSLSGDFLTHLSQVGTYMIDGDDLILRLNGTGDSMIFRNGGPAPEAVAPAAPEAAATEAPAGAAAPAAVPELVGATWQWEKFIDTAGLNNLEVKDPASYTVTLNADGTVAMKADCNQAAGTYVLDGANLTISVGPMTLAMCAADSLSEQFLVSLTSAAAFGFEEGKLVLDMMADGGTMIFAAAK